MNGSTPTLLGSAPTMRKGDRKERRVRFLRGSQSVARNSLVFLIFSAMALDAIAISYSFEELRRGVTESSAVTRAKEEGWIVLNHPSGDAHLIQDARTNKVVGTLWICSGRLYGYSEEGHGGIEGFVKRVAQFNQVFGFEGKVVASSKMLSFGESNRIEVSWEEPQRLIKLELTIPGPKMDGSQWVQYAAPSICR